MNKRLVAMAGATLLGVLAVGGTAMADPTGGSGQTGNYTLDGVGSDTIQSVWDAFSLKFDATNANQIASYDATGPGNTLPNTGTGALKSTTACQNLPRPNGSGSGRKALTSSLNNTPTTVSLPDGTTSASTNYNGCIDFARSSSLDLTTTDLGTNLTYVPFADDAVSFAVTRTSSVPRTLSITDLQHIYTCDPNYVGSGTNNYMGSGSSNGVNAQGWSIIPVLPQAGSGTRSYFESKMGITDANVVAGNYPCIDNGGYTRGGTVHVAEEHTSDFLTDSMLVPFSIPVYLNELTGLAADRRGNGVLGTVAGTGDIAVSNGGSGAAYGNLTEALRPPATFNFQRHVYDVVPRYRIDSSCSAAAKCGSAAPAYNSSDSVTQAYASVFGPTGEICSDTADLTTYHFLPVASDRSCGATTDHTGS